MHIETEYRTTREETLRGQRVFKRTLRWVCLALGLVNIAIGVLRIALGVPEARPFLLGVAVAILPELFIRWYVFRQRRLLDQTVRVVFTDEGVAFSAEGWNSRLGWEAFSGIRRRGGFWILSLSPYQAVLLPESCLDGGRAAELAAFLVGQGRLKG